MNARNLAVESSAHRAIPADGHPNVMEHRAGLIFVATLVVVLVSAAAWILNPQTLPVRHVRINGEFRHLSPLALQQIAEGVVQGGFFDVNVAAIRAALMKDPWVRGVTVRRVWPDELSLSVIEQIPVVRWGDTGLLNDKGEKFTPAPVTIPSGLPVLKGPEGTEQEMMTRYRYMALALQKYGLDLATLDLSERRSWSFTLSGGMAVVLGRRDFLARFDRFIEFVPASLADSLARIDVVDMRYTNGFSVHWKSSGQGLTRRSDNGQKTS